LAIIRDHPEKLKANIDKHGVRFRDAAPVLGDPSEITIADYESGPEERQRCPVDFSAPRESP
jgi:uncharacterized DUF497 family protein